MLKDPFSFAVEGSFYIVHPFHMRYNYNNINNNWRK